jgi:hypothetical protein
MTKPTIKIHNAETGEIVERELTAEELEQSSKDEISSQERQKALAALQNEKNALLVKLGITADEAKLLLS